MDRHSTTDALNVPDGLTPRQSAWEGFGRWQQSKIAKSPESFVLKRFPFENESWGLSFLKSLGPLKGKTVLDVGCGLGYFSVYAAKEGARVIAIDFKSEMLRAACMIANINRAKCQFQQAKASKLALADNSIDIVAGMLILHHLSRPDIQSAINEFYRVLKDGGKAIFIEPVENSRIFNFVQNIFPAGRKDSGYYRPSCLYTSAWTKYLADQDGRDITCKELIKLGSSFKKVSLSSFGFLNRFDRFINNAKLVSLLHLIDRGILKCFPFLKRYARQVIVEYQK